MTAPDRIGSRAASLNGFTLGLNWYLNTNFNVMFDWVYDTRDDVPANSAQGWVSGIGTEVQFQF